MISSFSACTCLNLPTIPGGRIEGNSNKRVYALIVLVKFIIAKRRVNKLTSAEIGIRPGLFMKGSAGCKNYILTDPKRRTYKGGNIAEIRT